MARTCLTVAEGMYSYLGCHFLFISLVDPNSYSDVEIASLYPIYFLLALQVFWKNLLLKEKCLDYI